MNVIFWTELYLPNLGGVEVFGEALMRSLTARGHTFTVVTGKSKQAHLDEDTIQGVRVYRFPFHRALISRDLKAIHEICERVSALKSRVAPDVIHVNTTMPSIFYHLHTAKQVEAPTMVTVHSPLTFPESTPVLFSRMARQSRAITAVSEAMRSLLVSLVPEVADRSSTVYNGLELAPLEPASLPFDEIHVVAAGRLVPEKGFDIALRAFHRLADLYPTAKMTIAGDGPDRGRLEGLARELEISRSVHFTGWVAPPEVPILMNSATMVLVPSVWQEPFGLVALQASQLGRPVIASRVGGLPEVVIDGQTGLLVEPMDSDGIFNKMNELVRNPALAERLGRQGRCRAVQEFTLDRCADRYEELYERIGA